MRKLLIIILIMTIMGCEESFDWENNSTLDILVVDGMITNERKAHEVILTRPIINLTDQPQPVSGANMVISDGTNTFPMTEQPPGSGRYFTAPDVRGFFGRPYFLFIEIGTISYGAGDLLTAATPLEDLEVFQNFEGQYELIFRESPDPAMIKYFLDWSALPECTSPDPEECRAKIIDYTLSSIDVNEFFKPEKERVAFPAGTRVIRQKFSLSEPHQRYIRSMLSETEWQGGPFDVIPGNVETNLTVGATGFFAASTVISDTTFVAQ